jgi:hypothetical protein
VQHLEVLVEERSMAEAVKVLLPKVLGVVSHVVHVHEGKHDLLKKLPDRLRGYRRWLPQEHRVLVLVDRDTQDCRDLKRELEQAADGAGLVTRTASARGAWRVANRIAIEELEAWYFGDWRAVRAAYPKVPAGVPTQAPYRDPDAIAGGTSEALERLLRGAGYFQGRPFSKSEAARAIAPHLEPRRNTSPSFHALRNVLQEMAGS